jgi:hypothetical protein
MSESAIVGDFELSSNVESAEEITANLVPEEKATQVKDAASTLGKKGGEAAAAAAAKRKAAEADSDQQQQSQAEPKKKAAPSESKPADKSADQPAEGEEKGKEKGEKALGSPRHDMRARMLQATSEKAELQRRLEAIEKRSEALENIANQAMAGQYPGAQPGQPSPQQPQHPQQHQGFPGSRPRPQAEDYDDHAQYIEELSRWTVQEERAASEFQAKAQAHAHHIAKQAQSDVTNFNQQLETAESENPEVLSQIHPKFWELQTTWQMDPNQQPTIFNHFADELARSSNSVATMVYLSQAENRDALAAILNARSHPEFIRAFVRAEHLAGGGGASTNGAGASRPAAPSRSVSKAKAPVTPVSGESKSSEDGMDLPFDQHYAFWQAKDGKKW